LLTFVPQNFDVSDTFCGPKYGRLDVNENPAEQNKQNLVAK